MRRRFAILVIVAAATLPAALSVQTVAGAQQPATPPTASPSTPPAQPPTPPAEPAPQTPAKPTEPAQTGSATAASAKSPGLGFAATAGMIFSPIKPGQEAAFEEV